MTRPKTKSDEEVLAASGGVLLRLGPHDFTLADIAKEAGLSPATLLQRFGSKRGLLLAFARRSVEQADQPFRNAAARGGRPLEILRRGLLAQWTGLRDRRQFANSLALLLEDVRDDGMRTLAGQFFRRCEAAMAALLSEAMDRGDLERSDPAALARVIHSAWNGAVVQRILRGHGTLEAWLDEVLGLLLRPMPAPAHPRRAASRARRGRKSSSA